MAESTTTVLVLGGGIHGAAVARELLLNGVGVVLVDNDDLAAGATSKSSRLIHGGLRYLEYGDVGLVRESLTERRRNLDLVRHFVHPLRLFIPVRDDWSGLLPAAAGFLGGRRNPLGNLFGRSKSRGFWPVRLGLSMYDWLASDDALPGSSSVSLDDPHAPHVARNRYRGMIAYSDAQMRYPERVVLALLADARQIAVENQRPFQVATYARLQATPTGWQVSSPTLSTPLQVAPAAVINVCGAAGDSALAGLGITASPLFQGTRGSHLLTWNPQLQQALKGQAVYAEAADGRPVFTLPFGDGVLLGTTDEPHTGDPALATTSDAEQQYLLDMVDEVFGIRLTADDVVATYCGVRPLPRAAAGSNAAISRDHSCVWNEAGNCPVLTLVGGKLTTWRSVAEELTEHLLGKLGWLRLTHTRDRLVPGNDPLMLPVEDWLRDQAVQSQTHIDEAAALWPLLGTRVATVLNAVSDQPAEPIADSAITRRVVRWMIEQEHVHTLSDLVERRLLTVFQPQLSMNHLRDLAECLIDTGRLRRDELSDTLAVTAQRLQHHYGRQPVP